MATALSLGVAAIGLAGAVIWTAAGVSDPQAAGASAVAADLDIRIREASAGAQARAETLAQLPRLAFAIATDERTFRDLTADELAFRPRPDEHIEIAQIPLGRRGGRAAVARSLLRLPDDRLPLPMTNTGRHVVIGGGGLHAVALEPVAVRERAHELRGAIAVARRIDLSSFASRLAGLGLSGRIDLASGSLPLGGADVSSGGVSRVVVLGSAPAERSTLVLKGIVAPPSHGRVVGPVALMAVSAVVARRLRRRLKPLAAHADPRHLGVTGRETGATGGAELGGPVGPWDTVPTIAPSAHVLAVPPGAAPHTIVPPPGRADAPTPVVGFAVVPDPEALSKTAWDDELEDGSEPTARRPSIGIAALYDHPMAESPRADPGRSHTAANTLPGDLFESSDVPLPSSPPMEPDDLLEREYQTLYTEFVRLRQTCQEPPCALSADRFVLLLRHQRDELSRKHGARDVAFRLAFQNGKAAIRFHPGPSAAAGTEGGPAVVSERSPDPDGGGANQVP